MTASTTANLPTPPAGADIAESVDDAIASRRSVRAFLPTPVPRAVIERILEVSARAPSGTNMQPWRIYVVANERGSYAGARKILQFIRREKRKTVTRREIHQSDWAVFMHHDPKKGRYCSLEKVQAALDCLAERGYLRKLESSGSAGRPSECYEVNPRLLRQF